MAQTLIHLDTSFLIRVARATPVESLKLKDWLQKGVKVSTSAIAWAEFLCGPFTRLEFELARRIVGEAEPFVAEDSAIAAELFNQAGRRRGSLIDCMIGATAVRLGASLATANAKDFRRFRGLRVVSGQ